MQWHVPVIPALGRRRQHLKLEASLEYIGRYVSRQKHQLTTGERGRCKMLCSASIITWGVCWKQDLALTIQPKSSHFHQDRHVFPLNTKAWELLLAEGVDSGTKLPKFTTSKFVSFVCVHAGGQRTILCTQFFHYHMSGFWRLSSGQQAGKISVCTCWIFSTA